MILLQQLENKKAGYQIVFLSLQSFLRFSDQSVKGDYIPYKLFSEISDTNNVIQIIYKLTFYFNITTK